MAWASFLIAIAPFLAVGLVCVVAFRRRRRVRSPLIVNPYTLVIEPNADRLSELPIVQPMPPTSTSQPL